MTLKSKGKPHVIKGVEGEERALCSLPTSGSGSQSGGPLFVAGKVGRSVPRDASPRPKFHATKPNPKAQAKPEER